MSQPMTQYEKHWIDTASLYELCHRNRFAKVGSAWFTGETGEYFHKVMSARRAEDPEGWTAASKAVGWSQ